MTAAPRHIGVIDIGKTNVKLAVVDLAGLVELGVLTRPNAVLPGPPWPHFDLEGIWAFLLVAFRTLHLAHRIDAISITTHGASAVLLDSAGGLAAPMLDYEHSGPDDVKASYELVRPPFALTGTPPLALGLSVGAQLHWQCIADPALLSRVAQVLTYPQYWAYRLTGVASTEVTSLGCHTDLWEPMAARLSPLVQTLGLEGKIAPLRRADDVLGPVLPAIAAVTGLPVGTLVTSGIHDSNASLYPHLLARKPPFAVVSTGTWVIVMAIGGKKVQMDPARDTLMNVNGLGQPTPSARFMGGRTFDLMMQGHSSGNSAADLAQVLGSNLFLLPSVVPVSGPFPGRRHRWSAPEAAIPDGQRYVAVSFHLALVTTECLAMTGAAGPVIVEGPFARNAPFLAMLAAATGRAVVAGAGSATGTALGAALLAGGTVPSPVDPLPPVAEPAMIRYAQAWRAAVAA